MSDIPISLPGPEMEIKGYRLRNGPKEGQYHICKQCGEFWYNFRSYIRTRKYVYDYHKDVYGKGNPRYFQPIGWFCKKCRFFEADANIPEPMERPTNIRVIKDKKDNIIGLEK